MPWHDPIVMIPGRDQRWRVTGARFYVLKRRILDQVCKPVRRVRGSVIRLPCPANRKLMEPQHIKNAHLRDGRAKQIRPLRKNRSNQEPAIRPTSDRDFMRIGIFLSNQRFGSRDEIVEHILFLFLDTGIVPFAAVLSAAAQIWES